jgi:hypothetical protein
MKKSKYEKLWKLSIAELEGGKTKKFGVKINDYISYTSETRFFDSKNKARQYAKHLLENTPQH